MKHFLFTCLFYMLSLLCFSQKNDYQSKETTDSSSYAGKTHQIKELEVSINMPFGNIKSGSSGINIDISELKKLPNIMGDADPFKALQYLGGISQAGEASANINVRGGNNDQNLILLNGCAIQNPTHVLGLFSVFNPDLIDRMKYLKSGIPAEYGGRLSSVVDIRNFTNIPKKIQVDGCIGIIASRLTIQMPLTKKLAIYASQRGSYIGAFVVPLLVKAGLNEKLAQNDFEFSDTNAGFSYQFKPQTKLTGYFYTGNDQISIAENIKYALEKNRNKWGNRVFGLQLQHIFTDKFSMSHALSSSEFYMQSEVNWLANMYSLQSNNTVFSYKSDIVYQLNKHTFKSGLEASYNKILPSVIHLSTADAISPKPSNIAKSIETVLYVRDELEINDILLNIGLRGSLYKNLTNFFEAPLSSRHNPVYIGLEPRFFSRWLLNDQSSVKIAASRHIQFFNRVPVVNFGVPLEIFVSTTSAIKPATAWHFSGGYFRNLNQNEYEISAELYYKSFRNILEFGGNINDLFSIEKLYEVIYQGKGSAFGAEFMAKKNTGTLSGWINYTLGWNYRQFDKINEGKLFAATNDRRHDLTAVLMYRINSAWHISATYSYATGSRLNLPRSWFVIDDKVVLEYSKYNAFKMPDYHRLDISANYKLKPLGNLKSDLNFSVYNVYNRANPFQVYYSINNSDSEKNYKIQMSYLIPILPALSWTFHF